MTTEVNQNNEDFNQQQDMSQQDDAGQSQQIEQQQPHGIDKGDKWDQALDAFIKNTDGPSADSTPQKPQQRGTQQQPNTQQQQQDPNATQQQRQGAQGTPPARTPNATPRKFGDLFYADGKGDIYDATGQLVAKQGYGRSVFHKVWGAAETALRENASYKQRLEMYENANRLAKDAGLTVDDQGAALQLMVQWKKDPVKTIGTLLTLAEQNGKDVSSIRQGGGGLNLADLRPAMEEMLQKAVAPFMGLVHQQQQSAEEQRLNDEVATQYAEFMEQFPDAKHHEDAIARVMRDHGYNHREAWFAVQAFAARNGLDISQPLAPQIQERQNPGNARTSGGGVNRQRPMPDLGNGRMQNNGSGRSTTVRAGSKASFDANDSWDKIGREIFASHGINLDG